MLPLAEDSTDAPNASIAVPGSTLSRQVLWLAGPVLVEQVLLYLVGLSDTILTGRLLAVDQLAAVTVASYLMWTLSSLLMVVSAGSTALVARRIGGGRHDQAKAFTQQSVLMAWIVGLTLMFAGTAVAPWLVHSMNLRGTAADEAVGYMRIVLLATPLLASQAVGVACLRGAGDTRTGMWVMVAMNLVNIAISWVAAVGAFGLPRMGLRGVALGTAVGEVVGGALVLYALVVGRSGIRFDPAALRPNPQLMRQILNVSLPAFGESATNSMCQLWFLSLVNRLGPIATAAHGVALRCESIAFLTIAAFSVAASTLAGQYLGAGRRDLARRAALVAWRLGLCVLSLLGTILFLLAEPMVHAFLGTGQAGVAEQGIPVLRLVAFALPALATINVLSGALRGAGDTRWPLGIVLVGYLLVRMPLTYALAVEPPPFHLPSGLFGAWVAMFVDLSVRGLLVALRFLKGNWTSIRL